MSTHPLILQLCFTRSEFKRALRREEIWSAWNKITRAADLWRDTLTAIPKQAKIITAYEQVYP
jgi:hypothetical protein